VKRRLGILITLAALLAILSPIGSQTVIVPSKEDRILERLGEVLEGQKALRAAVERIERKLGTVPARKAEEKVQR
jgi:hypothetical protein